MSHPGRLALAASFGLVLLLPAAAAAEEGESALSIGGGLATFTIPDHGGLGGMIGGDYERGLSDAFWLRASVAGAIYGGSDDEGAIYAGRATIGLTYVVDVLKYVPYIHLGLGGLALGGPEVDAEIRPLGEIGVGLDVLSRRGLSYGPFARLQSSFDEGAFVELGARMTWRWGFF
jgi:hypothetical protein